MELRVNPVLRNRIIVVLCFFMTTFFLYAFIEAWGWKYILIMKVGEPLTPALFIVLLTISVGLLGGLLLKDWKK